jgi:ankyrin repeat protein
VKSTGNELFLACIDGDIAQLRQWGEEGVRVTSAKPLCQSVGFGDVDVVRILVEMLGADVNQADEQDDRGCTPLLIVAMQGNLTMVKCLVKEFGADVSLASEEGHAPLHAAAENGHLAVMICLVKELGADVNLAMT